MTARRPSDERTVRRARAHEREPQDPLTGSPVAVTEATPTESVPVRHLALRMLEALA
jgi:hypothetical protein